MTAILSALSMSPVTEHIQAVRIQFSGSQNVAHNCAHSHQLPCQLAWAIIQWQILQSSIGYGNSCADIFRVITKGCQECVLFVILYLAFHKCFQLSQYVPDFLFS